MARRGTAAWMAVVLLLTLAAGTHADDGQSPLGRARDISQWQLRRMWDALSDYSIKNGRLPRDLSAAPAELQLAKLNQSPFAPEGGKASYTFLHFDGMTLPGHHDVMVALDPFELELFGEAAVLFADGRVREISQDDLPEVVLRSKAVAPASADLGPLLKLKPVDPSFFAARVRATEKRFAQAPTPPEEHLLWYTIDDGKTVFVDNVANGISYQKAGRMAYRAEVLKFPDGPPFVQYIQRYTPEAQKKWDAMRKENPQAQEDDYLLVDYVEYKRPGDAEWVSGQDERVGEIVRPPSRPGANEPMSVDTDE